MPNSSHAQRNLGYSVKIWFDSRIPLPSSVTVVVANGNDHFVRFLYENIPKNFCSFCYTIKHDADNCPSRIIEHDTINNQVQMGFPLPSESHLAHNENTVTTNNVILKTILDESGPTLQNRTN